MRVKIPEALVLEHEEGRRAEGDAQALRLQDPLGRAGCGGQSAVWVPS